METESKIKILVLDDDPDWLELYLGQFNDLGEFEVRGSLSYDEDLFDRFRPDVVVLDILLGPQNGLDVLEKIRSKIVYQKAILISSSEEAISQARKGHLPAMAMVKGFGIGPTSGIGLSEFIKFMCSQEEGGVN